eukprot:c1493_g1_i2.p1 GENE.c1493_g1_i2~~c1493_g1_i2.p1  ORF type:complete len:236 (+),score=74.51 c1493_g1_i2:705-1412(+)
MKGLASTGHGDYFFIDEPENIPELVQKGLNRMLNLIGINASLRLKSLNGAVVKKVLGYDNLPEFGISIGDVMEEEVRQLILEIDVSALSTLTESIDIVKWDLTIGNVEPSAAPFTCNGIVSIGVSDDPDKYIQTVEAVEVAVKVSELNATTEAVAVMVNSGKIDSAVQQLETTLENLEKLQTSDKTGLVKKMHKRTQQVAERVKRSQHDEGERSLAMKDLGYLEYQNNLKCSGLM